MSTNKIDIDDLCAYFYTYKCAKCMTLLMFQEWNVNGLYRQMFMGHSHPGFHDANKFITGITTSDETRAQDQHISKFAVKWPTCGVCNINITCAGQMIGLAEFGGYGFRADIIYMPGHNADFPVQDASYFV